MSLKLRHGRKNEQVQKEREKPIFLELKMFVYYNNNQSKQKKRILMSFITLNLIMK